MNQMDMNMMIGIIASTITHFLRTIFPNVMQSDLIVLSVTLFSVSMTVLDSYFSGGNLREAAWLGVQIGLTTVGAYAGASKFIKRSMNGKVSDG